MAVSLTNLLPLNHQLSSGHGDTSPHPDVAFWYQKGKYRLCFQRIVVMCVDLFCDSLRNQFRSSPLLCPTQNFLRVAPSKTLKGKYITCGHLGQRIPTGKIADKPNSLGTKRLREDIHGGNKSFILGHLEGYTYVQGWMHVRKHLIILQAFNSG